LNFEFFGGAMELEQQAKFDLLVRQLERTLRQQTSSNYQLRVAAIAAIGYGYIGLICLALFSSLWAVRWLMEIAQHRPIDLDPNFLWMLFGLVAIATFWVEHLPITKDLEIHRADFPELFTTIDELRDRLNAPRIHLRSQCCCLSNSTVGLVGLVSQLSIAGLTAATVARFGAI
jgi:hypothetical protein